jgi:ribose transport system ATP-binding protein
LPEPAQRQRAALLTGVSKSFGGTRALADVGFEIATGEVHALVGGNGCGKSTLIKILAGVQPADAGTLETPAGVIDLREMTPTQAAAAGFRFVHQAQSTFPDMTVAENLSIGFGFETGPGKWIREGRVNRRVEAVLERFGIDARPGDTLRELGPATQAMIEVARALQDEKDAQPRVLVLDEPTAALPPTEVGILLAALSRYAKEGTAVVFVSHRLDEVMGAADVVTTLRDGRSLGTRPVAGLTHDELVELIAGRPVTAHVARASRDRASKPLLEVSGLRGGQIEDASFTVAAGEIVGLAGLAGAGQTDLLRLLFGDERPQRGSVVVDGRPVKPGSTRAAIAAGIAFIPGDRAAKGVFDSLTVTENLTVGSVARYWRGGFLRGAMERHAARAAFAQFHVRAASPAQPIGQLSGGNQQKVVVARWLSRSGRRLLLLDEPTQGIDVGAREELWSIVRGAVAEGAAVIVASSMLEELAEVCDRVLILRRGQIVNEVGESPLTVDRLTDWIHDVEVLG